MNKIILCEGETDAVLLSYYLGKVSGWKFCKKAPANIAIRPDAFDQSANWYENGDDRLLMSYETYDFTCLSKNRLSYETRNRRPNTYIKIDYMKRG